MNMIKQELDLLKSFYIRYRVTGNTQIHLEREEENCHSDTAAKLRMYHQLSCLEAKRFITFSDEGSLADRYLDDGAVDIELTDKGILLAQNI